MVHTAGLSSAQTDPMNILEDDSQGVSEVSRLDVDVDHELQGRFSLSRTSVTNLVGELSY